MQPCVTLEQLYQMPQNLSAQIVSQVKLGFRSKNALWGVRSPCLPLFISVQYAMPHSAHL